MAALTIERYYCLKEQKMIENDKSKLKIILIYIILLWSSAICFTLPKTLSIKISNDQPEGFHNDCESSFDETDEKIFTTLKLLIAFAIPYSIIIVFSIYLLKFLNEWSKKSQKLTKYQRSTFFLFKSIDNVSNCNGENDKNLLKKPIDDQKLNSLNVPPSYKSTIKPSVSFQVSTNKNDIPMKAVSKLSLES